MDVWLDPLEKKKDLIIEFNSYGSWGNASSELFDWREDRAQLMGLSQILKFECNFVNLPIHSFYFFHRQNHFYGSYLFEK